MVPLILPLLTAALAASTPAHSTQDDNARATANFKLLGATPQDGSIVLAGSDSGGFFPVSGDCPVAASFFVVEAAIFPPGHKEEVDLGNVSSFLQSCLCLAKKNPVKAFSICVQLTTLSYYTLLNSERASETGRNYGERDQTFNKYTPDNENQSVNTRGFTTQDERTSAGNVLYRLRKGLAEIFPFSSFASGSTNEKDVFFAPQSPNLRSETNVSASFWNSWKLGSTREMEFRASTTGGSSLVQGPIVNLGTLYCRNLADFHAEGCACGVVKFVETSIIAAHPGPVCAPSRTTTRNSVVHASYHVGPIPTEPFCSGEAQTAVDLPLVSSHEYRGILSSPGNALPRIPSQVLQKEGMTYSYLWDAIDHLYQFHEKTRCLSDDCQVPCLLSGWTSEVVVDVAEPHVTPSNPLCVFARRNKSLLIVIRGALTPADWAVSTDYKLVDFSPGRGASLGKVSAGFLQMYAAIWPALQTFIVATKTQQEVERILITGHSMGAAVGALLSVALAASSIYNKQVDAVLFAPPRSGDTQMMDFWGSHVNGRAIQFSLDMITGVPCLRMPICEARKTYTDTTPLVSELSPVNRVPQTRTRSKSGSFAYEYGNYPNAAVFEPNELPNAPDQHPAHIHYNHFCAYACWLATRFDNSKKKTMCNKNTYMDDSEDPSVCPKL